MNICAIQKEFRQKLRLRYRLKHKYLSHCRLAVDLVTTTSFLLGAESA
jgi:hypothetical protein